MESQNGDAKMKWLKHDAGALSDAKIERLMMKFGIEGYGVYFAVVELIASSVSPTNITFQLEHDSEILAYKFRIKPARVEAILSYCVQLSLFERNESGYIACPKMATRLDNTMSQHPEIKQILGLFKESEDTREKIQKPKAETSKKIPVNEILDLYHAKCPMLPAVRILSDKRKKMVSARWSESEKHQHLEFWERLFEYISLNKFLCGDNDRSWTADFEWIMTQGNFIKIVEGKYK